LSQYGRQIVVGIVTKNNLAGKLATDLCVLGTQNKSGKDQIS
jgi:hypothetical protein